MHQEKVLIQQEKIIFAMVFVVALSIIGSFIYFWLDDDCEEKEIAEIVVCNGDGADKMCAYRSADDSFFYKRAGYKEGALIEVCRKEERK